jgi:Cys-tRNA(Pro)/Cys-tRNA(Cys) deacylase
MTPAVNTAKKAKIVYTLHSYIHDPVSASYGEEARFYLSLSYTAKECLKIMKKV